jgi:hypothetical protein
MKNQNILPSTVVPSNIRLEVYKEAIDLIQKNPAYVDSLGLCLLLPMLLWGLEDHLSAAPNGHYWNFEHTENMFPEMFGIVDEIRDVCLDTDDNKICFLNRKVVRERYLSNAIKKLSLIELVYMDGFDQVQCNNEKVFSVILPEYLQILLKKKTIDKEIIDNVVNLFNKKNSLPDVDDYLLDAPCSQEEREIIVESIYNLLKSK